MRKRHKTVFRGYFAWDYDKELQELAAGCGGYG